MKLTNFNKALLGMAVWELGDSAVEKGGSFKVWGRVGGWTSKLGTGVHGCGLWLKYSVCCWDGE